MTQLGQSAAERLRAEAAAIQRDADMRAAALRAVADEIEGLPPSRNKDLITLKQAAGIAGRDVRTVRRWVAEHGIGWKSAAGAIVVSRARLLALISQQNQRVPVLSQDAPVLSQDIARF